MVLAVIAAAGLLGCGGGDDEGSQSRSSTEFVQRVDALCKAAAPELAEIRGDLAAARDAGRARRVSMAKTFDRFTVLLRRASASTDRFLASLRAIDPPEGERAFHRALVVSVEEASLFLRQSVSAAEAEDAPRLSELSVRSSVNGAERDERIKEHGGFRFCGRG